MRNRWSVQPERGFAIDSERSGSTRACAIEFKAVSKRFPGAERPAVSDVSFAVEPGAFVVLLGPSGCGKTTLLKLVNRLYEPTSGEICIDGQPVHRVPAPELRRGIGYVIQQTGLFPHMRVADNIAVVPRLLGWERHAIASRIDELLDLVGLPPEQYRRRYPSQLSGGEQQRVGLARALAGDPGTLLMDEPFGALDAITRGRLQDELRMIHRTLNKTILFVTHDVEEAVRLADRIVVLNHGEVVQHGEPSRIVLQPADAFVADLVGSGDVLRRLSLMPTRLATVAPKPAGRSDDCRVSADSDLRSALSLLLAGSSACLAVVDDGGAVIGRLTLESIHNAVSSEPSRLAANEGAQPQEPRPQGSQSGGSRSGGIHSGGSR